MAHGPVVFDMLRTGLPPLRSMGEEREGEVRGKEGTEGREERRGEKTWEG